MEKSEIKDDKEVIVGKIFPCRYTSVTKEIKFYVKDVRQLCFNPYATPIYRYAVAYEKSTTKLFYETAGITKEQYEYLMKKLGG